jgi:hypothetical protein
MIFVIGFSCLSREAPTIRAFPLRPGHHHRQGKACASAAGAADQEKRRGIKLAVAQRRQKTGLKALRDRSGDCLRVIDRRGSGDGLL